MSVTGSRSSIADGSSSRRPGELVRRVGDLVVELTLTNDDAGPLLAALGRQPGHVVQSGARVTVVSPKSRWRLADRINALPLAELHVSAMTVRPATLNDVFLQLTASSDQPDLAAVLGSRT